jgi:hypothetical protein
MFRGKLNANLIKKKKQEEGKLKRFSVPPFVISEKIYSMHKGVSTPS